MEMMIAITIIAILTVTLAYSFSAARDSANFKDQKLQILNIVQEARSLSLSSMLTEGGEVVEHYELAIESDVIRLEARGGNGGRTEINRVEFENGFEILSGDHEIYYIPPYGEVCIDDTPPCDGNTTEASFILQSPSGQEATFTISKYGGYAEVE
jgi:type II secretory pathway pseudopilin PulG